MDSQLFFSLEANKGQSYEGGKITSITSKEVKGFINISFEKLELKPRAYLQPTWHPNANKIGFCEQGKAYISIRTPSEADYFEVNRGDIFFIPQGYVHHIVNIGEETNVIDFAYNHVNPEKMFFAEAIKTLNDAVFNSTFNTPNGFVDGLKNNGKIELIKILPSLSELTRENSNSFKFNVAASNKPINTKGGYLQIGTKSNLPILDTLGILAFGLNSKGVVEPHWHTNAGELVYIIKGKTRITVLSPTGDVQIMNVNAGQGAFAPASHFHNIENIGEEPVEVIAYFSHALPDYIGIGEVMGSYSNELLSSIFNVPKDYFSHFNKPSEPLVIVPM